jgi:hypothetical protein
MTGAPPCRSTRVQTKAATRLPLNLNSYLRSPRSQLDYERGTPSFFAISAVKNNTIYYSRCNFSHSAIHCFDLVYPEREKRAWDAIVTRISLSLRPLQK